MHKSSLFCIVGFWIFILISELIQIPVHIKWIEIKEEQKCGNSNKKPFAMLLTITCSLFFLLILTIQLLLVIAESSKTMPTYLKQISHKFLNSHNMRKYVIAFILFMMSFSCAISSIDMLRVPVNQTNHQHDNILVECSSPK